jgi:hypothetical protein
MGPTTERFEVVFGQEGNTWVASVTQTSGTLALPLEPQAFKGKSLASVEERASAYLDALKLTDWISSYDFAPALTPELSQLLGAALHASEGVDAAEYRKVRAAYRAIEALSSLGFTLRDMSVLLGESKTVVQQTRRLGRLLEEWEDECA